MQYALSKMLKQEVPTRFNCIYTMLASLDDAYDEITACTACQVSGVKPAQPHSTLGRMG